LNGLTTKLTLWNYFGDDSFGLIGRSASMVQMAADLMGKSGERAKRASLVTV